MTQEAALIEDYLLPEERIASVFGLIRRNLQNSGANPDASIIAWDTSTLGEINPNIIRSLKSKFQACEKKGFKAAKIAGLYAFWIAKLKPLFSPFTAFRGLNEYAGLTMGIAYIDERINLKIALTKDETLDLCETLRYHTSSPHTMMHLYTLLIEREKLKQQLLNAKK